MYHLLFFLFNTIPPNSWIVCTWRLLMAYLINSISNEITDFLALTDTVNVVVKIPGALYDKYFE
jgi:hypothetical protein